MAMTKDEYILRMITKISKKRWEFFVVSRIIHGLNDPEIEFVTQQMVRFPQGNERDRALTDLYFPQFDIHIEIDEGQHFKKEHANADTKREQDIVSVTEHDIWHIPAARKHSDGKIEPLPLSVISDSTDKVIEKLKSLKKSHKQTQAFVPWDFEGRYDPYSYQGFEKITVAQNVLFRKQAEALRLFGYTLGNYQRGVWYLKNDSGDFVWFPRLYKQDNWDNELSADGLTIFERPVSEKSREYYETPSNRRLEACNRIVFARAKDVLGNVLYRYVGTFKFNNEKSSNYESVFDRTSDKQKISLPQKSTCKPL